MSLKDTIETEYKNALKSKDKTKISTYRLILSSIKDLDISNRSGPNKKETDDDDIKKLLKKMVKQRAESIEIYKKNNRNDLLEIEQNEYEIITNNSIKDMGKVMGALKQQYSDDIDFAKAGALLKQLLN
ncbi:MAG: GatB/YqeY domain-containing protein [Proteobacteria bacterium]|nr:GatB/YqeY domain-containing protein [Pseudomonadota bacterium]